MELTPKGTLEEFLEGLASGEPTPGGGSAAALAGAMGAALVCMEARLTIGRKAYAAAEPTARTALDHCSSLLRELEALMVEDTEAYRAVATAMGLPKETEAEKAHRRRQVDRALVAATEVPWRTARACLGVAREALALAPLGNRNAVSDLGVAALLAQAGLEGAVMNVEVNLASLGERAPAHYTVAELGALRAEAKDLLHAAMAEIGRRMRE